MDAAVQAALLEAALAKHLRMAKPKVIAKYWYKERAGCTAATVTLTFSDLEKITGRPLPPTARKQRDWWSSRQDCNMIAEAWITEGYDLQTLDMKKEKLTLRREMEGYSKLSIPTALTSGEIPDNARFELETHMKYIIQKYGLG